MREGGSQPREGRGRLWPVGYGFLRKTLGLRQCLEKLAECGNSERGGAVMRSRGNKQISQMERGRLGLGERIVLQGEGVGERAQDQRIRMEPTESWEVMGGFQRDSREIQEINRVREGMLS